MEQELEKIKTEGLKIMKPITIKMKMGLKFQLLTIMQQLTNVKYNL